MECNKWEEYGLLFISGELNDGEKQEFEQHLKECDVCSQEEQLYRMEKERFYTPAILEDLPSPACDAEIMRVCGDGRKKVTGLNPIPLFIRRTAVSLVLFAVGFIGVGYVTLKTNSHVGKGPAAVSTAGDRQPATEQETTQQAVASGSGQSDSAVDSSSEKGVNFSKTRGNLDLNGVYPVDLQNK